MPPLIEAELRVLIADRVDLILSGDPAKYRELFIRAFADLMIVGHDLGIDDALQAVGTTSPDPRVQLYIDLIRIDLRALRFREQ